MRKDFCTSADTHAIIGKPISHSLSPIIYNTLYDHYKLPYRCRTFCVPENELSFFLYCAKANGIGFLNVTSPYKMAVLPLLDYLSDSALQYGSVNTITTHNGLRGYSTDAQGFLHSLHKISLCDQDILLLGAGGAATTIAVCAAQNKARSITLLCPTIAHAQAICKKIHLEINLNIECNYGNFEEINRYAANAGLVINATPLGMSGYSDFNDLSFVDYLPQNATVYDIVYSPAQTSLLLHAQKRDLKTIGGIEMLIHQAFAAFEIFHEISPTAEDMINVRSVLRQIDYPL